MKPDIKHTDGITLKRIIVLDKLASIYVFIQERNEK